LSIGDLRFAIVDWRLAIVDCRLLIYDWEKREMDAKELRKRVIDFHSNKKDRTEEQETDIGNSFMLFNQQSTIDNRQSTIQRQS
jgi:hypothetical protein